MGLATHLKLADSVKTVLSPATYPSNSLVDAFFFVTDHPRY